MNTPCCIYNILIYKPLFQQCIEIYQQNTLLVICRITSTCHPRPWHRWNPWRVRGWYLNITMSGSRQYRVKTSNSYMVQDTTEYDCWNQPTGKRPTRRCSCPRSYIYQRWPKCQTVLWSQTDRYSMWLTSICQHHIERFLYVNFHQLSILTPTNFSETIRVYLFIIYLLSIT